jgi:cytosine permease
VSANSRQTGPLASDLPPILLADLISPSLARGSWVWTIGPAYTGVFIWVPLLDRLGTCLLGEASLGWLAAAAVLAALACYILLYNIPAMWGWKAGHRLSLVGASTFGTAGSEWITGVAVGLAAIVFYAVSLYVAIKLTLFGLLSCGLIDPSALERWHLGPLVLESPVFLLTALFWIYLTGMASLLRLVGVIFALMQVYTPVVLVLLGVTAFFTISGLPSFAEVKSFLASLDPSLRSQMEPGMAQAFQLIFGYFALSGLMAVEWGMVVRERRDVRIGGWISIILAGSYCVVMALLTVAGALDKSTRGVFQPQGDTLALALPLSFHWAILRGIGGITGGVILMLFGLATLAPGCYSAWVFSRRLSAHWSRIRRFFWTWIGGFLAFVLIATSWAGRLEEIFVLMGAIFAPAVGALTVDALREKRQWHGIRQGWNSAGLLAWGFGVLVGLVPVFGALLDWTAARRFQPASLYAFLASAALYLALAAAGLEPPLVPLPAAATEGTSVPVPNADQKPARSAGY